MHKVRALVMNYLRSPFLAGLPLRPQLHGDRGGGGLLANVGLVICNDVLFYRILLKR